MAGEPVTQQGLDTRCELWLDQVFGLKLDFAIENSLPVCLEDGVIERDAQVLLLPLALHASSHHHHLLLQGVLPAKQFFYLFFAVVAHVCCFCKVIRQCFRSNDWLTHSQW